MSLNLDIEVSGLIERKTLIAGDGDFSITFIPKTPDDVITLYNASIFPDMLGDNILTQLRLVHGSDPGPYIKNTSEASRIAQIFNHLQQFRLDFTSLRGDLESQIVLSRTGLLAQFVDNNNNVRTDIASIAGKLLSKASSTADDKVSSLREQTERMILDKVTTYNYESIYKQQADSILAALKQPGKPDALVSVLNLTPEGVRIKGKVIDLDGDVNIDSAFAKKLTTESLSAENIEAVMGNFGSIIAQRLDVNKISGNKSEFLQSLWRDTTSVVEVNGKGITAIHNDGSKTMITAEGLYHEEQGGSFKTSYLKDVFTVTDIINDGRESGGESIGVRDGYKWVQLPDIYKGKQFRAQAAISDTETWRAGTDYNEGYLRLLRTVSYVVQDKIDYKNARVPLVGYAHVFNARTGSRYNYPIVAQLFVNY